MYIHVSAMAADTAVACVAGTCFVAVVGAVEGAVVADAACEKSAEMVDWPGSIVRSSAGLIC